MEWRVGEARGKPLLASGLPEWLRGYLSRGGVGALPLLTLYDGASGQTIP